MPANNDVIYSAVTFIQSTFEKLGKNLAPSHAHELTAAYMGFNSKKALIDSGEFDLNDPELVLSVTPDISKLGEKVRKLRPDLLQKLPLTAISRLIKTGLTPPCECCGYKLGAVVPITGPEHRGIDGWVCMHCVDRDDRYDTCRYCDNELVYRAHNINRHGECPVHAGESALDPEEEAGYNDLAEYWLDR